MKEAVSLVRQARRSLSFTGPVAVVAFLHPPDRRVRDIDNTAKPLLDALVKGGLIKSDYQVSLLLLKREEVLRGGRALVVVLATRMPCSRLGEGTTKYRILSFLRWTRLAWSMR